MPQPRAPRGSYRNTPARRAEIVQVALDIFAAEGYESASLRMVAARVGISHTTLLHHFASKEELLTAVLERREAELRREFRDFTGRTIPTSIEELFEGLRDSCARHLAAPELARLWASLGSAATRPDHAANDYFVRRYNRVRRELAIVVAGLQATGELDPALDSQSFSANILAVLDGLQVQSLLDPELDIDRALTTFFAPYLRAQPSSPEAADACRPDY
jgi:AcrR family transcriptional regulator